MNIVAELKKISQILEQTITLSKAKIAAQKIDVESIIAESYDSLVIQCKDLDKMSRRLKGSVENIRVTKSSDGLRIKYQDLKSRRGKNAK